MSRKKRPTSRNIKRAQSSIPSELQDVFRSFKREVERANDVATEQAKLKQRQPNEFLDYGHAIKILNENPRLTNFLEGIVQRREAEAQALGRESGIPFAASYAVPGMEDSFFAQKRTGPPTGSHPQASSAATGWWSTGGASSNAPQGVNNAQQLRYFADNNEWVRAAINIRRQQVGRADIAVLPHNERKTWNRQVMKKLQRLLDQPNIYRDSYRSLIEPVIEDILVLDRGAISKNMTPGGRRGGGRVPTELYYEDGATIKVYTDWDGNPKKPRYLYEETGTNVKVPLRNDELICMSMNPATYRLGLSPVQFLRQTIQAEMRAIQSATHIVDMKPAPHIVQIPGAHQTQITNLKNNYDSEVAGRKELFWMGGENEAKVFSLTFSARDNQWLEWQQWLARKIATAFQISPQQFGFTADINKATGQTQQEIYEDTGLIPLLLLLEEYLNRELLMDFCPLLDDGRADLEALNLRIVYPEISEAERTLHAERAAEIAEKTMGGLPTATVNQILMMRGEEPVPGGNTFWVKTATGAVPWLTYDHDYGDWSPLASLGGFMGAQDVFGGPDEESDDDAEKGGPNEKPEAAGAPAGGSSGSGSGSKKPDSSGVKGGDESSASGLSEAPNFNASAAVKLPSPPVMRKSRDLRRPGHRWNPAAQDFDDEAM